jgi:hypothetical protein
MFGFIKNAKYIGLVWKLRKPFKQLTSKEGQMKLKRGIWTSEFWTRISVVIGGIGTALASQDGTLQIVGIAVAGVAAVVGEVGRALVKIAAAKAGAKEV